MEIKMKLFFAGMNGFKDEYTVFDIKNADTNTHRIAIIEFKSRVCAS
jgi:hypothetical protein